jgi:hypothetical protein
MKRTLISFVVMMMLSASVLAGDTYCDGYIEGWKIVFTNNEHYPGCPGYTGSQAGVTPYQQGLKEGIRDATKEKAR